MVFACHQTSQPSEEQLVQGLLLFILKIFHLYPVRYLVMMEIANISLDWNILLINKSMFYIVPYHVNITYLQGTDETTLEINNIFISLASYIITPI